MGVYIIDICILDYQMKKLIFIMIGVMFLTACQQKESKSMTSDELMTKAIFIYAEIALSPGERKLVSKRILSKEAAKAFDMWIDKTDKVEY